LAEKASDHHAECDHDERRGLANEGETLASDIEEEFFIEVARSV
jgi:hypothetical protein